MALAAFSPLNFLTAILRGKTPRQLRAALERGREDPEAPGRLGRTPRAPQAPPALEPSNELAAPSLWHNLLCPLPRGPPPPRPCPGGMVLPFDVLRVALAFLPMNLLGECSRVCRNWAPVATSAAQLHRRVARALLYDGLSRMTASNQPHESVALFTRALALDPCLADAAFWKAKGLFILNEEASAVGCLTAALERKPGLVARLKLQACVLYAHNNDLQASRLLETARRTHPTDSSVHFELGFCYHGLQRFPEAIASYTRALELGYPRTFVLLANRANCRFRINRVEEALADLEASLGITPHYELALRTRAFVNLHLGHPDLAHRDYTLIIEHSPTPRAVSDAFCNRAFCHGAMDELDLERAKAADPTNPEPVRYQASACVARGDTAEAITLVTAWLEVHFEHKDRAFQMAFRGELYATQSDWGAAVQDYQTAVHLLVTGPAHLNYAGMGAQDSLATYRARLGELQRERLAVHAE